MGNHTSLFKLVHRSIKIYASSRYNKIMMGNDMGRVSTFIWLRFTQWQRFKSQSYGLWYYVVLS